MWYIIIISRENLLGWEDIMMKVTKEKGLRFLNEIDKPITSKDQIFDALFEVCGIGDAVNTKHVFFQEVIIKFNASKARAVIEKNLPYLTESHFVDVAIYAYIKAGYDMKDFDRDLTECKKNFSFLCANITDCKTVFANA